MKPALVSRMQPYATSIFAEMSILAAETGAINLGQGFPDTDGPEEMKEAARAAITEGRGNQYPPVHGLPELRLAIAEHQQRFYGLTVDPMTDVVVTTGATEAIQSVILAFCERDDEVVVFEPWFDIYATGIALAGATRVSVPLRPPTFRPDIDALRDAITDRTRLLIVNSPHNPTGVVFTREELQGIADIAIERDLIVLSDEVYEHLWYDGHPHIPIATLPGMAERTITLGSAGKSFSFTGWKVGWATGPTALIQAVRSIRQHLSFVSGGPFQHAIAHGLRMSDSYYEDFRHGLQAQRDLFTSGVRELGFTATESQGTYFLTTDLGPMTDYPDALAAARDLPRRAGVVAIPQQALCDHAGVQRLTGSRLKAWRRPGPSSSRVSRTGAS